MTSVNGTGKCMYGLKVNCNMIYWRLGVFDGACSVGNKLTGARQTEGVVFRGVA